MSSREISLTRFEGTDNVLVVGWVEDISERAFPTKDKLAFVSLSGDEFILMPSPDVQGLDSLSAQKITVLGLIDDRETPPHLTVLGYRVMPMFDPENDAAASRAARQRAMRKRAA